MDTILKSLQGKSFHLSQDAYEFLSRKYESLASGSIPDTVFPGTDPGFTAEIVQLHRSWFRRESYIESRIKHPTSGTIDHIHAEVTAYYAELLAETKGLPFEAVQLPRAAGHLHDIDRTDPEEMTQGEEEVRHNPEGYIRFKAKHAQNSVRMAQKLIRSVEESGMVVSDTFIEELSYLILHHETGGEKTNRRNNIRSSRIIAGVNLNDLADVVKDADSISYFDANILTNWEEWGKDPEALANKVHFMYDRMGFYAKKLMEENILYSPTHILGISTTADKDAEAMREVLLAVCG